jgi:hypothetical protein
VLVVDLACLSEVAWDLCLYTLCPWPDLMGQIRSAGDDMARIEREIVIGDLVHVAFSYVADQGNGRPVPLGTASNRDVHDDSKNTTLPIAREIVDTTCITQNLGFEVASSAAV